MPPAIKINLKEQILNFKTHIRYKKIIRIKITLINYLNISL